MARQIANRDISATLTAAEQWIATCLIEDKSLFGTPPLWTGSLIDEVHGAFVDHPDFGKDDFITKLKGQMRSASPPAQQLLAEMLWALLLFPSNMKARTKRQQIREMWALSGSELSENHPLLRTEVLTGIGSGGPGFNNYRPDEMTFLIELARDLKRRDVPQRKHALTDYDAFMTWIEQVPREGSRQYRHMLRYFAFPDTVERISSNNDRWAILEGFGVATGRELRRWTDRQLDEALFKLRKEQGVDPDFYAAGIRERWTRKVKTPVGEVTVVVPTEQDDDLEEAAEPEVKAVEARQSFQIQAKLAEIGSIMGFSIWLPRGDRARVRELMTALTEDTVLLNDLPLNYDKATLDTIEQIDVLWLKGKSMARAFEVEHSTAVYSGLLRMADLLALQPNIDICLHIVAPEHRRDKVFRELQRPAFSYVGRGALSESCTFISYESVEQLRKLEHLVYTSDKVLEEYEDAVEVR